MDGVSFRDRCRRRGAAAGVILLWTPCLGGVYENSILLWLDRDSLARCAVSVLSKHYSHSPPSKAGHHHAVDRRWQAVSDVGGRTAQFQFLIARLPEAHLAADGSHASQHRPQRGALGADRTPGGQGRLLTRGQPNPRRAKLQSAAHFSMVRELEERGIQLHSNLGEN